MMKVTGHTTRSTFDRYNIVDEEDAREVGSSQERPWNSPGLAPSHVKMTSTFGNAVSGKGEAPRLSHREASRFGAP